MNASFLAAIAGIILSLFFGYVPGLAEWFDGLQAAYKRLIMAVLILLVAAGSVGIACAGYATLLGVPVTCDQAGFVATIQAAVAALIANQATYTLFKKSYRTAAPKLLS